MATATKRTGMIGVILDHLKNGNEITAIQASQKWNELNLRNKICILRSDGYPIHSREEKSKNGGFYKVYFLDGEKKA